MDNAVLNTISLCSGVAMLEEGLHAGLEYLGIRSRTVVYAEREAFPVSVLAARMEEGSLAPAPVWFGDFTELPARRFRGVVDGVVAGFPCQDLSIAGRRAGLDGKRSGLFFNVLDIADDCDAWFLFLENVLGIATATASVVDEEEGELEERAASRVMGELADRGWHAEWITLSASDVGASHGRARWFCFAWRMADARLQHGDLQQWRARPEHSGSGEPVDDAPRHGRIEGRAEPGGQQGRSDVAEHGGAVGDTERARWAQARRGLEIDSGHEFESGCGAMANPSGARLGWRQDAGADRNDAQQGPRSGEFERGCAELADAGRARLPKRAGGVKTMDHFNRPAGPSLPAFIAHSPFSPQAQATPGGPESSLDSPGSPPQSQTKKLNSYFVEWLMGWRHGWTSPIALPDSAPAEMALYRSALRQRLSSLFSDRASFKDVA